MFYFFKERVSIRTCVPNLGAVRRSCRKKARLTLIIDQTHNYNAHLLTYVCVRFGRWKSIVGCDASEGTRVIVEVKFAVQKEAGTVHAVSVIDDAHQIERSSHPLHPRCHRPRLLVLVLEPVAHEIHLWNIVELLLVRKVYVAHGNMA